MADIMDYIAWRGDLSFKKSPVNEVDIIIFSQIAMLDLSKSVHKRKSDPLYVCEERFSHTVANRKRIGFIIPERIKDLFSAMAKSRRFSQMLLSGYVEDIDVAVETQFSALIFDAVDIKTRFVVFSGTDDTIIGWKENFNLLYKTPTEAQKQAVKYLNHAAKDFDGKIIVLGHSKGGHLAMYSTINCQASVYEKIVRAVNIDGPGLPDHMEEVVKLRHAEKKIITYLPQNSIIGRLFEHGEDEIITHSTAKGLFQHDCFSWQVCGKEFIRESFFTTQGNIVDYGFRTIISDMSPTEREQFVEGLFALFTSTGCNTLTDLAVNGKSVVKAYFKLNGERRRGLNHTLFKLFSNKPLRKFLVESGMNIAKYNSLPEQQKLLKEEKQKNKITKKEVQTEKKSAKNK